MKKRLGSWGTFWVASALLFVCAYVLTCTQSRAFGYYAGRLLGYRLFDLLFVWALLGGLVAFAVLIVAVWHLMQSGKFTLWRKLRLGLGLSTFFAVVLFLLCVWASVLQFHLFFTLFFFPLCAYGLALLWLTRLVAFWAEKNRAQKNAWWAFYRQFPFPQPIGLVMTLLWVGILVYFSFQLMDTGKNAVIKLLLAFVGCLFLVCLSVLAGVLSRFSENKAAAYEDALQDKLKAERLKTELITNVSHDIKTPLTSIINYADLLNQTGLTEEDRASYTAVIHKKSLRLKALIEDLIEASKAGTGNIQLQLERINLCELVGQILGEFDEPMVKNRLQMISQVPEDGLMISADGRHLWRVLENLFGNTIKFALEGTRVYAELKQNGPEAVFTLKNVSRAPLNVSAEELTEQFVRGDRARLTEGSGLGLYIAKSLVEAMGGRFGLEISGDLFTAVVAFSIMDDRNG